MKYNLINENFTSDYAVNLMRSRGVADLEQYKTPGREFLSSPTNLKNIAAGAAMYLRVVMNDKPPYSKVLIVVDSDNSNYFLCCKIY